MKPKTNSRMIYSTKTTGSGMIANKNKKIQRKVLIKDTSQMEIPIHRLFS